MRAKSTLKRVSKIVLVTAGVTALAYVGGAVLASWVLVRPGRRDYDCISDMHVGAMQPVTIVSQDGVRLHGWVLLTRKAHPDDWVLLLHGYRSKREAVQNRARFFSRRGFNVLLLHFRGHGSSDPARISHGFHERWDVKAAFDFILSLRPGSDVRIGVDGISMGAAAASYAIGEELIRPHWLILESCYDNVQNALANRLARKVGETLTPVLRWPIARIVEQMSAIRKEDLDPAKALEKSTCPVLVMAGDSEVVLKAVEIDYLYQSIPKPKQLEIFVGAGHEDLLLYDPKSYARAVTHFLTGVRLEDVKTASE